jgi:LysM repeat protein
LIPTATATVLPPTAAFVKYRVRIGDTLTAIAARYRVTIQSILLANKLRNDFIYADQELIIPLPTPHP